MKNKRWWIINGICLTIVILSVITNWQIFNIGTGVIIALSFALSIITVPIILFLKEARNDFRNKIRERGQRFWVKEAIYDITMLITLLIGGWSTGFLLYLIHSISVQYSIKYVT